jgi:uncharacterized phage protein (TIGR02218 family)
MTRETTVALASHLQGTRLTLCNCWRIERRDGVVLGFTDHDQDLILDGVTYSAAAGFDRTSTAVDRELTATNLSLVGVIDDDSILAADILNGRYQGAAVYMFRLNYADSSQGVLRGLRGHIGRITVRDGTYVAELFGLARLLQQDIVENYTVDCLADLGDDRCKVDLAGFSHSCSVSSVSSRRLIAYSGGQGAGYFTNGYITFTSGDLSGWVQDVRYDDGSNLEFFTPLPGTPAASDAFTAVAGCDKRLETCRDTFSNVENFRGHGVLMPGEDEFLIYPDAQL